MKTKLCPRCNQVLPLSEFHKDRSRKAGIFSYCKACEYANTRKHIAAKPTYYAQYQAEYRLKHLQGLRQYGREYSHRRYIEHKTIWPEYVRTRRARIRANGEGATVRQIRQRVADLGNKCIYCDGPYESLDHIIPVSRNGHAHISNIVPSCRHCNYSKGNRDVITWFRKHPCYSTDKEAYILGLLADALRHLGHE